MGNKLLASIELMSNSCTVKRAPSFWSFNGATLSFNLTDKLRQPSAMFVGAQLVSTAHPSRVRRSFSGEAAHEGGGPLALRYTLPSWIFFFFFLASCGQHLSQPPLFFFSFLSQTSTKSGGRRFCKQAPVERYVYGLGAHSIPGSPDNRFTEPDVNLKLRSPTSCRLSGTPVCRR